jgi:WD40 repeat protein
MTSVKITATASLLHNNLTGSPAGWLAGMHNSADAGGGKIFLCAGETSVNGPEVSQVTSVRYLQLAHATVLCVSSNSGTQIYSEDCSTLLYAIRMSDAALGDVVKFHRGACVVQPLQHIAIGTSKGGLSLVDVSTPGNYNTLPESNPSVASAEVADVCYVGVCGTVATAHDDGVVQMWATSPTGPYVCSTTFPSQGDAPVRMASLEYRLMVAYATGHIRIFDAVEFNLQIELTAHARNMTAVDVREELGQIASVGEDTVLNVWHLDPTTGAMSLQFSTHVAPKLLTGVVLTPAGASVTAYDADEIYQVALPTA